MKKTSLPVIAIVGRPNVGKSALFNAILRKRISIVHEQCGVTRDRVAAAGEHFGRHFTLVDTGGLGTLNREKNVDIFDGLIREQVEEVVKDAAALIWVVNCQDGITPQDEEVGDFVRKTGKPVVLCANKADNMEIAQLAQSDFARLGIKEIAATSCTHSYGISHLMDEVCKHIPVSQAEQEAEKPLRVAVVGRPNVGKSSLVNRLFGEERVMVSDIAGTTRDAIDIPVEIDHNGEKLPVVLVDTAGMRRKRQVDTVVEFFSVNRTESAIRRSDIVLFVIDSLDPCTTQERRIARVIVDAQKPCIMLANKWDLLSKDGKKQKELIDQIRADMAFMNHAPLLIMSAQTGFNVKKIYDLLSLVRRQMDITVPTGVFNQFLQDILMRNPPSSNGTRRFKVFYGTMVCNPPAKFVIFCNSKKLCPTNYLQFLENQIRNAFFPEAGLPIIVNLRERERLADANDTRRAAAGAQRQRKAVAGNTKRRIDRARGHRK